MEEFGERDNEAERVSLLLSSSPLAVISDCLFRSCT